MCPKNLSRRKNHRVSWDLLGANNHLRGASSTISWLHQLNIHVYIVFFWALSITKTLPIGQVLQSEAPGAGGDPWQRPAALPRRGERPGRAALRRRSGRAGGIAGAECVGGEQRLGGEMSDGFLLEDIGMDVILRGWTGN